MSELNVGDRPEILWGAKAIGEEIDRNERQAFYLLEAGAIPCAKKIVGKDGKGGIWAAARRELQQALQLFITA